MFSRAAASVNVATGTGVAGGTAATTSWWVPDLSTLARVGGNYTTLAISQNGTLWATAQTANQARLMQSPDGGNSWTQAVSFGALFNHPSGDATGDYIRNVDIVRDDSGNEIMFADAYCAKSSYPGKVYQGFSIDRGKTWSANIVPNSPDPGRTMIKGTLALEETPGVNTTNARIYWYPTGGFWANSYARTAPELWRSVQTVSQILGGSGISWEVIYRMDIWGWYVSQHPAGIVFGQSNSAGVSGGGTSITDTAAAWAAHAYEWVANTQAYAIKITGGTGIGQCRLITDNGTNVLTLYDGWEANPDSTSTYEIMQAPGNAFGYVARTVLPVAQDSAGNQSVVYLFNYGAENIVCKLANVSTLPVIAPGLQPERACQPWNSDLTEVLSGSAGELVVMGAAYNAASSTIILPATAKDNSCFVASSPDHIWSPTVVDSIAYENVPSSTRSYWQNGYASCLCSNGTIAFVTRSDDYNTGLSCQQQGLFLLDPTASKVWRIVRSATNTQNFTLVSSAGNTIVGGPGKWLSPTESGASFRVTPTWAQYTFTQVAGTRTNLCTTTALSCTGDTPTGWAASGVNPSIRMGAGGWGGGNYCRIANSSGNTAFLNQGDYVSGLSSGSSISAFVVARPENRYVAAGDALRVNWYQTSGASSAHGTDTAQLINSSVGGGWQTLFYRFNVPSDATQAKLQMRVSGGVAVDTVDFAYPCFFADGTTLQHMPCPSGGVDTDVLKYAVALPQWTDSPCVGSKLDFLFVPYLPTDTDTNTMTLASVDSFGCYRAYLTYCSQRGLLCRLTDSSANTLAILNLGTLPNALTSVDLCECVLTWAGGGGGGQITCTFKAGADVLSATAQVDAVWTFLPTTIQLGGDQWQTPGQTPWEGWYSLVGISRM